MGQRAVGGGYISVGSVGGAAIRLHWSLLIGALGAAVASSSGVVWGGLLVMVILHEAGHAALARRYRLRVHAIDVHLLGGRCVYQAPPENGKRAVVAWGGVLAQALLLAATWLATGYTYGSMRDGLTLLTYVNMFVIGLNLLPFPGLDGAEAWSLFSAKNMRKSAHKHRLEAQAELAQAELARLARREQRREKKPRELN